MSFAFAQLLTGLANAASLFLIASGLSIIFGVTRIVNFAHGSLYMLGAYVAYTMVTALPASIVGFWTSILVAAAVVAMIGAVIEILVLRRLYGTPELFPLVATFGVVLIVQDATLAIWGPTDLFGPRAPGLDGAVRIFGEPIPQYDLALIVIGPVVLAAIWLLFHRTRWGILVRAATEDRDMVSALGVDQRILFTSAFVVGSFLAGLGGALQIPRESVTLQMDLAIIAEAFVVVVIGGMGSVVGAFVAAVIISVANAFGVLFASQLTLVLPFLIMAVVLIVRPYGLFGTDRSAHGEARVPEAPLTPLPRTALVAFAALFLGAVFLPAVSGSFALVIVQDIVIAMVFAASLHLMMGVGGMVSFGHAAYFGLGAYGTALAVQALGLPFLAALTLGPVAAALGAALFGAFCVRLSGVYLAMLTLAAAQIVWGVTYQWQDVTGGDDGILGVWPPAWTDEPVFYLFALTILCAALVAIRHLAFSPFGMALRATRDSPRRAGAIGISVMRQQWIAFVLAGAFAGLAGAVFAFAKGSVFPDTLSIAQSVDGLIMVLLGGVQSLLGPLLGAAAFVSLEDAVSRLDYWRFLFGVLILAIVLIAPDGLAGAAQRISRRLRRTEP